MDQNLEIKNIPSGYNLCFNEACKLRDNCMHYQAYLRKPETVLAGPAIYPDAWKNGQCEHFNEVKIVTKAWGFTRIYNNVPQYLVATARRKVSNYFSRGCGPYYRYHHGENKLTPHQQQDILNILAQYGPTEGLAFDHYETDWDFNG